MMDSLEKPRPIGAAIEWLWEPPHVWDCHYAVGSGIGPALIFYKLDREEKKQSKLFICTFRKIAVKNHKKWR